jgi:hypothetical protein
MNIEVKVEMFVITSRQICMSLQCMRLAIGIMDPLAIIERTSFDHML